MALPVREEGDWQPGLVFWARHTLPGSLGEGGRSWSLGKAYETTRGAHTLALSRHMAAPWKASWSPTD